MGGRAGGQAAAEAASSSAVVEAHALLDVGAAQRACLQGAVALVAAAHMPAWQEDHLRLQTEERGRREVCERAERHPGFGSYISSSSKKKSS